MWKDIKVNLMFVFIIFFWGLGVGLREMQQVIQLAHHTVRFIATEQLL